MAGTVAVKFTGQTRDLESAIGRVDGKISGFGKKAALALTAVTAAAGVLAVKFGKDAVNAASALDESMSKVNVVFGDAAKEVQAWSKKSAVAFGQSRQSALEAAGTYGNLFQAFGLGREESTKMSTSLVELAADLASFNNTSVDDALLALRSGLSGEAEPMKKFGASLSDARLKEEALRMGLIKTTKDALNPAAKAQAAYALIMKDTTLAQGDFGRTSDGLANKQRIFAARIEDLKARIGQGLLPVVSAVTGFLSDKMVPAFENIAGRARQVFDVLFKGDFKGGPFQEDSPFILALFKVREWFQDRLPSAIKTFQDAAEKVSTFVRSNLKPILIGLGAAVLLIVSPALAVGVAMFLAYQRFRIVRDIAKLLATVLTNFVLPAVKNLADFILTTLGPQLLAIADFVDRNREVFYVLAGIIATVLIPHYVALGVAAVAAKVKQVAAWVATQAAAIKAAVVHSAAIATTVAGWIWIGVTSTANALKVAAAWVIAGGPIVWLIAGFVSVGLALVALYQKSETFRDIVKGVFGAVSTAAGAMKDFVVGVFREVVDIWLATAEWIVKGAATAFGWVPKIGPKLKDAAKAVEGFRDDVNGALGGIHDKTIEVKLSDRALANMAANFGVTGQAARIAGFRASGGPVSGGRPYIVGEKRPELFVPDRNGTILPSVPRASAGRGGGGNTYIINASSLDSASLPDLIVAEIKKHEQRNGAAWRSA